MSPHLSLSLSSSCCRKCVTAILAPVYPAQDSLESLHRHERERGEVRRRRRRRESGRMTMILWQEMLYRYGIYYVCRYQ